MRTTFSWSLATAKVRVKISASIFFHHQAKVASVSSFSLTIADNLTPYSTRLIVDTTFPSSRMKKTTQHSIDYNTADSRSFPNFVSMRKSWHAEAYRRFACPRPDIYAVSVNKRCVLLLMYVMDHQRSTHHESLEILAHRVMDSLVTLHICVLGWTFAIFAHF